MVATLHHLHDLGVKLFDTRVGCTGFGLHLKKGWGLGHSDAEAPCCLRVSVAVMGMSPMKHLIFWQGR